MYYECYLKTNCGLQKTGFIEMDKDPVIGAILYIYGMQYLVEDVAETRFNGNTYKSLILS